MLLSKNLKRLRLEKGWTQEELAERVGVTGQAVSKWERDGCYPDITLLPGLANGFNVTVDELLGMSEIKGKMWGIYAKANALELERKYHDAVAIYDEALKTFPADTGLLVARAKALVMAGENEENGLYEMRGKAAYNINNAIELYERRLEEDNISDHSRSGLVAVLCFLYRSAGMLDKAELLARRRPHAQDSRELLLPNFLAQPERDEYLRENLPGILTAICELISGEAITDEEHLRRTALGSYKTLVSPVDAVKKIADFLQ